jgi:hypothetical protein
MRNVFNTSGLGPAGTALHAAKYRSSPLCPAYGRGRGQSVRGRVSGAECEGQSIKFWGYELLTGESG